MKSQQSVQRMNLKSSHQVHVEFAQAFLLHVLSMLTHVSVIRHFTGLALSAFHVHNVLVLKVTWLMRSVKLIRLNNALIVFAKLVAFLTVNLKFVNHAEKDYEENRHSAARVNALSVHLRQSYVKRVANVFLKLHGVMAFRIVLTTRRIAW